MAARVDALRAAGLAPGQVAVLVRTNAQTLALERALAERACPARSGGEAVLRPARGTTGDRAAPGGLEIGVIPGPW